MSARGQPASLRKPIHVSPGSMPRHGGLRLYFVAILGVMGLLVWAFFSDALPWTSNASRISNVLGLDLDQIQPDLAKSIADAVERIRNNPESAESWGNLAVHLFAYNLSNEAQICFQKAQSLDPQDFLWVYLEGVSLAQTEPDDSRAIDCFFRAIELRDNLALPRMRLADLLMEMQRYDEAQTQLDAALSFEPENALIQLQLGRLALLRKAYDESLKWTQASVAKEPDWRASRELLAEVYHRLKQPVEAANQAAIAEELPRRPIQWNDPFLEIVNRVQPDPEVQIEVGHEFIQMERPAEAVDVLTSVVQRHPEIERAHVELWYALIKTGDFVAASRALDAALQQLPSSTRLIHMRGVERFLNRNWSGAEEYFRRALSTNDSFADSHLYLGMTLRKQRKYESAIESYKSALRYQLDYTDAHIELGEVYYQLKETEKARQHLESASKLAPENTKVKMLLREIANPTATDSH